MGVGQQALRGSSGRTIQSGPVIQLLLPGARTTVVVQLDQLSAVMLDHLGREHAVAKVARDVALGAG